MKRRITSLLLVIFMVCGFMFNPKSITEVKAEENTNIIQPTKLYSLNNVTTVTNGSGAIEASKDDVLLFKELENFTMNTTLTMTTGTSTVQGIFFIGDSTQSSNYITIYFVPGSNKIGIESKTGGINTSFVSPITISDGQPHKFTFTVSKGNYYRFYVDGKKVNEGTSPTTFSKGVVANADHMMFGNGKRSNGGNGYPLNGTLKNIELYDSAISESQILSYHEDTEEKGVFSYKNAYYTNISDQKYESNSSSILSSLKSLDKGSITVRYRSSSETNGLMSLFSISDSTNAGKYLNFYISPKDNSIGVEVLGTTSGTGAFALNDSHLTSKGVSLKNTNWHTVTVTKTDSAASNRYTFYIDGKMINFYSSKVGFTNNVNTADTISIGHVKRLNNVNNMPFIGAIDYAKVLDRVLSESEIQELHKTTMDVSTTELDLTNAYKTEAKAIFYSGYEGSSSYRIPSLLTTKEGTVIAAIDKRNQHSSDWGNIDTMIRRKEVGDTDFNAGQVILDLADNTSGSNKSAFLIDPSMVQDKETGRIYLLVDMFPESTGLADSSILQTGTGYKKIDGKDYQILYDSNNNEYTIREDGKVYNSNGDLTEYTIIKECEAPYKELGNIYKNGVYKGNIYLFSGSNAGELHVVRTSYIWLMHSDDDGKTWSIPKDITPQIKKDWMKFIGTGPGVGIQLENGKLVFPVYHTNVNVGGSQSSAVIVSEDKGENWTIGESPNKTYGNNPETMTGGGMFTESQVIQTNNGELKLFMRNTIANTVYIATSKDEGKTWYKLENDVNIPEIYCQLSVINFEKDGKEYVMLSNPSLSGRQNGKVHLGEIAADGSITWTNSQLLSAGHFQYSCLTQLSNGKFAATYELDDANGNIAIYYTEFDEGWIKATTTTVNIPNPNINQITANFEGNNIIVNLSLTQKLFVAGNPTLSLKIGNKNIEASYVKGSGTNSLVFKATISGDESGQVIATNINETNGIIENALGGKIPQINKSIYDLTKINKESYSGVKYTTQQSDSTAENTDGAAINVIDGNKNTYWHSVWGNSSINLPQSVTLELKEEAEIYKLSYLPRQNSSSGRVKEYEILVSTNGIDFNKVANGTFLDSITEQSIEFIPVNAKYIKFQVNYAYGGGAAQSAAIAELSLYKYSDGLFGEIDKSILISEVEKAKDSIKGEYSQVSINNVKEALIKAEEILSSNVVSQSMIDNVINNLKNSEEALINISDILSLISEYESMDSNDYTIDSWQAYSNSIDEAVNIAKTATTKKQVTDIIIKIIYMKTNLIKEIKVDKTELSILYESCKSLLKDNYTEESWKVFEQVFIEAGNVLENINSTQEQVNLSLTNLHSAISNLENVKNEVDKSELEKIYYESIVLKETEYTKESWKVFSDSMNLAKAILDNEESTQEQVNNILAELKLSIKQLEGIQIEEIDITVLQNLVNLVKDIDLTLYVEKGKNEFNDALLYANKVLESPESNEAVEKALKTLSKAYLDLRLLPNKELVDQLIKFIEEVKALNIDKYSTDTKNTILRVVEEANNVLLNSNMTEEEVLEVINNINSVKLAMADEDKNISDENNDDSITDDNKNEVNNDKDNSIVDDNKNEVNNDKNNTIVNDNNEDDKIDSKKEEVLVTNTIKSELPNTGSDSIYLVVTLAFTLLIGGSKLYKKN